jgi:fructokinase
LVLTVAPEAILIGGGVVTGQPHLLDRIRFALVESLGGYGSTDTIARDIDTFIAAPGLGDRAGPLGSLALGADALLETAALRAWPPAAPQGSSVTA